MTQKLLIVSYINAYGSITPMEAFDALGITKLATRIGELKGDGFKINTEMVKSKNRHGKTVKYARYSLPQEVVNHENEQL